MKKNATPAQHAASLVEKINGLPGGKPLFICGFGKCRICGQKAPDIAVSKTTAMLWMIANDKKATEADIEAFQSKMLKWEVRALTTGVHQPCQRVEDQRNKKKAKIAAQREALRESRRTAKTSTNVA